MIDHRVRVWGGRALWAAAAVVLLLQQACGGVPEPRPNVILISIDTLRADHLSCYGYERETTPALDALARGGVRFANAYSTSSWTVPAMASLLTSLHPESHGVVRAAVSNGQVRTQQILSDQLPRLPELLRGNGYRTFGVTTNGHLDEAYGYARGFDRYRNLGFGASAGEVGAALQEFREEIRSASPYFLWLHYFDPHAPYVERQPWLDRYGSKDPEIRERVPVARTAPSYGNMEIERDSPELKHLIARYDAEISYTDQAIADALRVLDVGDETMIVVTSDHGEEFLDHARFGHKSTLYEELIRVPLIMRLPGGRFGGQAVEQPVSIVDVVPSVLGWLDLPAPPTLQGEQLIDRRDGPRARSDRAITATLARRNSNEIESVILDGWKLIRHAPRRRELLFHLSSDPREAHNLIRDASARKHALALTLDEHLAEHRRFEEPPVIELTDERLEELRSLGYVQ